VNNLEAGMNKETKRDQVLAVVSIVVVVILIALFWENNFVLLLFVAAYTAFLLTIWHEVQDLRCLIFVVIVGTASEIVSVYFGAWTYNNPTFLGIPIWLPLTWGIAVLCLRRFIIGLNGNEI
jgi:uncharacterized membrane protein YoaT (DUF817 family)